MSARRAKEGSRALSVIVPCYNEPVDNITELTRRLTEACDKAGVSLDLLFMDDESAGSAAAEKVVNGELQNKFGKQVRIHCRKKVQGRGLSSAVVLGFEMAKYDVMLCMDGDLQHEPEAVPSVAGPVLDGKAEFTVGSRFTDGGEIGKDWPAHRRLISWGATMLATPLAATTDPMSGLFCLSREVFDRRLDSKGKSTLQVSGFKISLELMARCKPTKIVDVGISFKERVAGESKLTMKQNVQYVKQLGSLYKANYLSQLILLFLFIFFMLYYAIKSTL